MKKIKIILCYGIALMLFGCASAKKAELTSGSDPAAAISEVTNLMLRAEDKQTDLLTPKQYLQGSDYLNRAKRGLSSGHKNEKILDNSFCFVDGFHFIFRRHLRGNNISPTYRPQRLHKRQIRI